MCTWQAGYRIFQITSPEECVDVNNPFQTVFKHFKLYILTQLYYGSIIMLAGNV